MPGKVAAMSEPGADSTHGRTPTSAQAPGATPPHCLADLLRTQARIRPQAAAVIGPEGMTTFAELNSLANRVAQSLAADGVHAQDRVVFLGSNSTIFLASLHGTAKLGAIPTFVNTRTPENELYELLCEVSPAVVVIGSEDDHLVALAVAVPGVLRVVTAGPETSSQGATVWAEWLVGADARDPGAWPGLDQVALLCFTSGTTGAAKPVCLTGRNIFAALSGVRAALALNPSCVVASPIPFFHVNGLGLTLAATLAGAAFLLENVNSLPQLTELWQRRRVTHAVVVPSVVQALVSGDPDRSGSSAIRCLMYSAVTMPVSLLTKASALFDCFFLRIYGLTETAGLVTLLVTDHHSPTPELQHRLQSVGRTTIARIRIVDPVTLADVPTGHRGEVLVAGDMVMKRYWGRPQLDAEVFLPGGWLRTGDAGSLDDAGYLFLHDRISDMIVSGGERIYPADVERVLSGNPSILDIAVVGTPSAQLGEAVYAFAVPRPGTIPSADEFLAWSSHRLTGVHCPVGVSFLDALPRTTNGRLRRVQLRERLAEQHEQPRLG